MTGTDRDKDGSKPDHEDEEGQDPVAGLAYEPSVNQTGHHPMPASADEDKGQAAVRESEEHWRQSHGHAASVRRQAEHGKSGSASQAVPDQSRASRKGQAAADRDQEDRK